MNKEDKRLLLAELSSRLIYKVHLYCEDNNADAHIGIMTDFYYDMPYTPTICIKDDENKLLYRYRPTYDVVKLYLRSMATMTDEESNEWAQLDSDEYGINSIDWLNAHHFDYRGLIEKGLAIEEPERMYKQIIYYGKRRSDKKN